MIQLGSLTINLNDPLTLGAVIAGGIALLVVVLLISTLRRAGQSAAITQLMASQLGSLGQRVQSLSDGQQQLAGGLTHVSDAQAAQQAQMLRLMEQRLAAVSEAMSVNLSSSARKIGRAHV